jgi:hypothetical protein
MAITTDYKREKIAFISWIALWRGKMPLGVGHSSPFKRSDSGFTGE